MYRLKRHMQIIANHIVIKMGSNSFFNKFGNILEIGHTERKSAKTSGSVLAFFSKGRRIAHFSYLEVSPVVSDKLIILVSIGTKVE